MTSFSVTFDYLCPFARNASEAVLSALPDHPDWQVTFRPFSLSQAHLDEGEPAVWEREPGEQGSGVLALQWGLAVRDGFPEAFPAAHRALFAARHDHGLDCNDPDVLAGALASVGLEPEQVAAIVAGGKPLAALQSEHTEAVDRWGVFGVPTFIVDDQAVFVRMMERDRTDDLERVIDLVSWTRLNEFKRTRIPR